MSKRRAGTELTDRNWEEEDEPEEAGSFEPAEKKELAQRVIRKARRRVKAGEGDDMAQDDASKPSPFVGFTFGAKKPSTDFSFKSTGSTSQAAATSFSFKPSVPDEPPALAQQDTVVISSAAPRFPSFGKAESSSAPISTNGTGGMAVIHSGTPSSSSSSSNQQYTQKLQNLNCSVSAWIQRHVSENPVCDLTPIFEDYKKHLGEIEKLRVKDAREPLGAGVPHTDKPTEQVTVAPSAGSTYSFGKSSETKQTDKSIDSLPTIPATSTYKFGSSTDTEAGTSKADFSFKVSSAPPASDTTSGFSFGRSETAGTSKGFAGGKFEASGTGSLFGSAEPFSFGGFKSSDDPPKPDSKKANDDDYVPPKEEIHTVQEKDSLYSKRCKLFYKKGDGYKDRGVGMLHLKKLGDTLQLLVRADTNLGNVILNIMLPASLPVSRQGKNNLLLMTPINPPAGRTCPKCNKKYPRPQESNACDSGCVSEASALLIRVKTGEEADKVLEKINQLREA